MKIRARAAVSAASILLVAAGAAGCGGSNSGSASSSGASSSAASTGTSASSSAASSPASSSAAAGGTASQDDFCGAFETFEKDLSALDPSSDPTTIVAKFKSEADKLKAAGTPSNIPADAKSGFAAVLQAIDNLPDSATLQDLSKLDDGLSATDKKNGVAFETYLGQECPALNTAPSASVAPSSVAPSSAAPSASTSN